MATRSAIGMQNRDGSVTAVYCHWDGYPHHNGAILAEHYDRAKTQQLLALGDLSILRAEIGEPHAFSQFDLPKEQVEAFVNLTRDWCTFYGRDRGETDTAAKTYASKKDFTDNFSYSDIDYFYLLADDAWQVRPAFSSSASQWEDLADLLIDSAEEMA